MVRIESYADWHHEVVDGNGRIVAVCQTLAEAEECLAELVGQENVRTRMDRVTIEYERETRDWAVLVDGQILRWYATRAEAEEAAANARTRLARLASAWKVAP